MQAEVKILGVRKKCLGPKAPAEMQNAFDELTHELGMAEESRRTMKAPTRTRGKADCGWHANKLQDRRHGPGRS